MVMLVNILTVKVTHFFKRSGTLKSGQSWMPIFSIDFKLLSASSTLDKLDYHSPSAIPAIMQTKLALLHVCQNPIFKHG